MRSRLPAVLLLLVSAFLLGPAPGGLHPSAIAPPAAAASITAPNATAPPATAASITAVPAAWWTWWSSPDAHADQDAAVPRSHLARGLSALPMWPAVLPSCGQPDPPARPITTLTTPRAAAPQPAARRAPARAPPSTTR
ncbi:hypothetical protein [Nonomuraea sp. NPDC050786]|uniref:hypothetical protein n=1 Tax=Nonomuraea sp. NPDC050786 TaxID=3154840 RepID=UPI0033D179DC